MDSEPIPLSAALNDLRWDEPRDESSPVTGPEWTPTGAALAFYETLIEILPCKTRSDRTCFRRLADWLRDGIRASEFDLEIFEQVLLYAREAALPSSRNPNAVFMSILRKELGYAPRQNDLSARP
jgi:hypothetical protein